MEVGRDQVDDHEFHSTQNDIRSFNLLLEAGRSPGFEVAETSNVLPIGPPDRSPDGKLDGSDGCVLRIAVGRQNVNVVVEFGTQVS